MSSEHPPEEQELQRPVGYTCIHCEGWGPCVRCRHPNDLGEQGLTGTEKEVISLRNRIRDLETECTRRAQSESELRREIEVRDEMLAVSAPERIREAVEAATSKLLEEAVKAVDSTEVIEYRHASHTFDDGRSTLSAACRAIRALAARAPEAKPNGTLYVCSVCNKTHSTSEPACATAVPFIAFTAKPSEPPRYLCVECGGLPYHAYDYDRGCCGYDYDAPVHQVTP